MSRLAGCALPIHRIQSHSKPRGSSRHSHKVGCTDASYLYRKFGTLCETRRSVNPRAAFASTQWHAWIQTLSQVCESLRDKRWSASCSLALQYKFAKLLQSKQSQFSASTYFLLLSLSLSLSLFGDFVLFGEEFKYHVGKMHDQFKVRIETDDANRLAKEIRDVYCQLSTMMKNQAPILSQTNGLLAASAIGLPT